MKILIINGSPHKGNTWALVERVKSKINSLSQSVVFEEVHLQKIKLPLCTGCSACFVKGNQYCPHYIEVQNIIDKIEESDAVIFASSCYANSVTALAKNLIDHMSFITHRPRFFGKKILVVSTAGGKGSTSTTKYLAGTFLCWGFNRCHQLAIDTFISYGNYVPKEKVLNKCDTVAESFYYEVANGKLKSPKFVSVLVYNIFRGMSNGGKPGELYDNIYWNETGLVKEPYSPLIPTSLPKKAFGNILYYFVSKVARKAEITYRK